MVVLPEAANCATAPMLGRLGSLATGVGVNLGIEYHNVYILAGSEDVIQAAEADIVSPAVAAEDPDGLFARYSLCWRTSLQASQPAAAPFSSSAISALAGSAFAAPLSLVSIKVLMAFFRSSEAPSAPAISSSLEIRALTDRQLAVVHAKAVLCVVLEQAVRPSRAVAVLVNGVRAGSSRAAPDRRATGCVGDIHTVAADLSNQAGIRSLGAACAGAGELKQRLLELAVLDRIYGNHIRLLGNLGDAVIEGILLGSFLLLRNHGERLGRAHAYTDRAAHAVERGKPPWCTCKRPCPCRP